MTLMTVQSSFDEILESIVCPLCGTEGMIQMVGVTTAATTVIIKIH